MRGPLAFARPAENAAVDEAIRATSARECIL
jgi:hypothetical protein